jgi:hypothetical protein
MLFNFNLCFFSLFTLSSPSSINQSNNQLSLPGSLSPLFVSLWAITTTTTRPQDPDPDPTHESIPRAFLAPKNMTSAFSRLALITVDP